MTQVKQILKSAWYRTTKEGQMLPLFYDGRIVKIRHEGMKIESEKLPYDSRIHLSQALIRSEVERFEKPEGEK
jgi:hypothetical protein